MNREQIENLVVEATGRSDKLTLIRSAIDIAVREVSAQRLWSDLMTEGEVTIASGAGSVALASDVARIIEIRVLDGPRSMPLFVRPKTWLIQRVPDPSARAPGRPCYGYLQGTTLFTIPYADQNYDIAYTYFRLHPALSSPTSEVLIRLADSAVAAYATHWVFKSIEKHEDSQVWLANYAQLLSSAIKADKANSVVKHIADQHQPEFAYAGEYWLDPFVMEVP